jgi:uncharacterized protein YutE (UPF0331/DUF86 family)
MRKDVQYDIERIGSICSDIKRYMDDLDQLNIRKAADLSDKRNFYAVSMILFSLLNRVIDLGSEMTIAHDLGVPKSYREIFVLLWKNNFIDENYAKEMSRLVTYRNLLSHEYQGITPEKVFELTKKVVIIKKFAQLMQEQIMETHI